MSDGMIFLFSLIGYAAIGGFFVGLLFHRVDGGWGNPDSAGLVALAFIWPCVLVTYIPYWLGKKVARA